MNESHPYLNPLQEFAAEVMATNRARNASPPAAPAPAVVDISTTTTFSSGGVVDERPAGRSRWAPDMAAAGQSQNATLLFEDCDGNPLARLVVQEGRIIIENFADPDWVAGGATVVIPPCPSTT